MQREFPLAPLVGVGAVIIHEGRVLLAQRGHAPLKGHWTLPGGVLELGESLAEGVVREVREETGLMVEPVELIELIDRIHKVEDRIQFHYVIADYLCRVTGGGLQAASDVDAVRWVERSEWIGGAEAPSAALYPRRDSIIDPIIDPIVDPITARVIEKGWLKAKTLGSHLPEGQ